MKTESVKIPTHLMNAVRKEAEERGCFIMRVISEAIKEHLVVNANSTGERRRNEPTIQSAMGRSERRS